MSLSSTGARGTGTPEDLFYWIPGELVVVVQLSRRPAEDALEVLAEQVRSHLNVMLAPHNLALEPYGTHGRWLEESTMPSIRRRTFIFGLDRQQPFAAIFFHVRYTEPVDPSAPDCVPMALSHLQLRLEQLAQAGLYLVSAMPNWIVTAAPMFYGDGGPALPPRPAPSLDLPAAANSLPGWHISFLDPGMPLDPNGAEEVMVAILDTAHRPDRVLSAAIRPEFRRNALLQRLAADLRNENGSFEIEYDHYPLWDDVRSGRDFQDGPRYYLMPDHGIFVAGLIRDIAPRARIRLIRILNDYGGGDLYNLFAALTDLEQELMRGEIRRLVINLSLTVTPDIRRLPYVWLHDRQWPPSEMASVRRFLAHIEDGIQKLCESLYAHRALIVAAAGNDSISANKQNLRPRPPRAPARYETILSVTSVNSRFEPSVFANAARMLPLDNGVATFGGDVYGSIDQNGLPDAVRGVYISPTFPSGEQNLSGWADWCGTSFSTPIISALGAHLMAQQWPTSDAMTRIAAGQERRTDNLFGPSPQVPSLLANVVRVQQRFE